MDRWPEHGSPGIVIAVPVRNEAERIADLLHALAAQRRAQPFNVLLLLNDCTDATAEIVQGVSGQLPFGVIATQRQLPPRRSHVGAARRIAMNAAARPAGPGGIILTTDADGRPDPLWLAGNLRALREGADAVAGRAVIDPVEALLIPPALHAADARECHYSNLLDEIHALLDPDPADPWPRHLEASGASLAVTVAAYRRAGGVPSLPLGEDRAFVAALRRADARVRHAPEVWVTVSGRLVGRAAGGMADTMRRRMTTMDTMVDDRLEPAARAARRARLRAATRACHRSGIVNGLASEVALPAARIERLLALGFGRAWERIEAESPLLRPELLPVTALPLQTARATAIRDALRRALPPAHPADSQASVTA
jgi:Glycosyl transferase family 2